MLARFRFISKSISVGFVSLILFIATDTFAGDSTHVNVNQRSQRGSYQFIIKQFYTDMTFLLGEKDFYGIMGGLSVGPSLFSSAFRHEDPEFTELWGRSQFADNAFEAGEIIGDGIFPVSLSAASWTFGKLVKSSQLQDFGTDLIRAQAANAILTTLMKRTIDRTRPDGSSYSYPSGHTSATFATAGVVYKHFGKIWGIPAFALATYVGFSRLQENKHYLSDIVAGGILGSYVSLKLSGRDTRGSSISVAPYSPDGGAGLAMSLRF